MVGITDNQRADSGFGCKRADSQSLRATGYPEVPIKTRHQTQCTLGDGHQNVFVGGVLRATRIRMRHPNRRHAQTCLKEVVGNTAAGGRNDCRFLIAGFGERPHHPLRPGIIDVGAGGFEAGDFGEGYDIDMFETVLVEMRRKAGSTASTLVPTT